MYDGPDVTFSYIYCLLHEEFDGSVASPEILGEISSKVCISYEISGEICSSSTLQEKFREKFQVKWADLG